MLRGRRRRKEGKEVEGRGQIVLSFKKIGPMRGPVVFAVLLLLIFCSLLSTTTSLSTFYSPIHLPFDLQKF
jgi:hypothetical protein